jgi:hypothetical protein
MAMLNELHRLGETRQQLLNDDRERLANPDVAAARSDNDNIVNFMTTCPKLTLERLGKTTDSTGTHEKRGERPL